MAEIKITKHSVEFDPFADGDIQRTAPMTESQKEVWSSVQMGDEANCAYNESMSLSIQGEFKYEAFQQAINDLIHKHDAFRMTFSPDGMILTVTETLSIDVPFIDLSHEDIENQEKILQQLLIKDVSTPFSLEHGPLIRTSVIKLADRAFRVILTAHHIVCDGWAMAVAIRDLGQFYKDRNQDRLPNISPEYLFTDYAIEDNEHLSSTEGHEAEQFWLSHYSGEIPILSIPTDRPRPPVRTFEAHRIDHELPAELVEELKSVGARAGATFITILLAGFKAYLYRITNQNDLIVGTPTAGQSATGKDTLVGHCVNLLPLRSQIEPQQTFLEYLNEIRSLMLDAFEYQRYTFVSLIKKIQLLRDPSRIPLIPIIFNMDQQSNDDGFNVEDLQTDIFSNPRTFETFEIFLNISSSASNVVFECTYNANLFDQETIRLRLAEYETFLASLAAVPEAPITEIQILPNDEMHRVLVEWNKTELNYSKHLCLHQLFEKQAAATPDRIAAEFHEQQLTYQELNRKSTQLAHYLIHKGVTPGMFVGICIDRSLDMLVALLAILKSGGAYVPLDPEYPQSRLEYMAENADLSVLITQEAVKDKLTLKINSIINIDTEHNAIFSHQPEGKLPIVPPTNLAYVIYTSGSTGKPKGVQIHHRSAVNLLTSMAVEPGISESDILLAVITLSFDMSVPELFLPLTVGAKVVIADSETIGNGEMLAQLLHTSQATILQATPATWHMITATSWNGSPNLKIIAGGEALPKSLASELLQKSKQVWNMYGPTEITVYATCYQVIDPEQPIFIGHPIANAKAFILDARQQPVPVGVPGELYIGGVGVSRGYLNREELTSRQFRPNPFANDPDELFYKTGDLVRYHQDGNIEYIGRIDNQVKIRGFRIELDEIEAALTALPGIFKAVVIPKIGPMGDARLIAYFVGEKQVPSSSRIRTHLNNQLPSYMVPQHFMRLDEFPLTPVGKIDKKALLELEVISERQEEYVTPSTKTESTIAEIWQNVLDIKRISIHDNFFDIGGHSLLAIQVVAKIKKIQGMPVSLRDFFKNPTISGLADLIKNSATSSDIMHNQNIPKRSTEFSKLSFQQQRLWYLNKFNPDSTLYNVPAGWRIKGPLNVDLFEHCINQVFKRHEILRTAIKDFDDGPKQIISSEIQFSFNRVDLCQENDQAEQEKKLREMISVEAKSTFDLSLPPLFKASLYCLSEREHVFSYMPHHIIWDGWSFDIFRHELKMLYESSISGQILHLPELPIQYGDFSEWQRNNVDSSEFKVHIQYWKQQLGNNLPVLQLPTDHPRPSILTYDNGGSESFELSRETTEKLTKIARESEATLFMLLLATFNLLLHHYSNDQDIVVGTPISGRDHDEIANLIGFFVNTLIIRTKINPAESFQVLLEQVRELCLDAFSHQQAPFEQLVEILNPERDLSHSPLFQVLFIYQDARNRKDTIADLHLEYIDAPTPGTQTDIDCWVRLTDTGISGGFRYNLDLFEPETIQRMIRHYKLLLKGIIKNTHSRIQDILLIQENEYQHILYDWNQTRHPFPDTATVHQLFEKQAAQTPDAIAVRFQQQSYSYQELNEKSNQWAHKLIELGVKENSLVGICLERSLDMMACLLGALKAGAAYLPLDPDYPAERLNYMAENSNLNIVLTQNHLQDKIPSSIQTVLFTDESELSAYETKNFSAPISPEDLAYIIYTSGSTGKPKGVQVPHRALANFLLSMQQEPGIKADDTLLAVTTLSFDIAGLELFLPLISGAACVIADRETAMDGQKLARLLSSSGTTIMQATPGTWRMLIAAGWQGQENLKILCGGEAFPHDLVQQLLDRCSALWNMYGPTETTIWSTCMQITDSNGPISIGRPIANTQVYVLDPLLHPAPVGVAGELYIGGTGVSKGYLHREELTQHQFIPNPFTKIDMPHQPALMYRTGDRVRFLSDGSLEYLERIDNQVKVRGFRIELGEIEACLTAHAVVNQAVVVCREDRPGDKRLYAYILAQSPGDLNPAEFRRHIRTTLPEYMVPQHFVEIDNIPLTPAGKVDRKSLPAPGSLEQLGQNIYTAPATKTEQTVAGIWQDVISLTRISMHDNFFDIGGHSLLAVELFAMIKRKFNLELPLALLFKAPTIHDLAGHIDAEIYLAETKDDTTGAENDEREEFEF